MLQKNNKLQEKNIELYKANQTLCEGKSAELVKVINLKEEQIRLLEALPRTVITEETFPLWKKILLVLGALGTGVTIGIIYENNR